MARRFTLTYPASAADEVRRLIGPLVFTQYADGRVRTRVDGDVFVVECGDEVLAARLARLTRRYDPAVTVEYDQS